MNHHDVEDRLRESLRRNALNAPPGDVVAQRVLHQLDHRPLRSPRRWRAWALPLAVAAAVAITGTVLALAQIDRSGSTPVASQPPSVPSGQASRTISSGTSPTRAITTAPQPMVPTGLRNVTIRDLYFTTKSDGWLLASADCSGTTSNSDGGRCTALLRTSDGGQHWSTATPPPAPVKGAGNCTAATPCVEHIVFADDRTGYAFGPDVLLSTTDGGQSWTRQSGLGADALEILDNTVILVRAINTSCPQRCTLLETSALGSTKWTPFTVTDPPPSVTSVSLTGQGTHAQLLLSSTGLARGDGQGQESALYVSSDGGHRWTAKGEQCPRIGAGYTDESFAMTASSDGAIVIDCVARNADQPNFAGGLTITSTDHGEHFAVPQHGGKLGPASAFAAATGLVQMAYASSNSGEPQLYRSTDGGDSWSEVPHVSGSIFWIGFQSSTVGRIISAEGRTVWTTSDGGATWTHQTFP